MQLNENVENETDSSSDEQEETQLSPLKKKERKIKFYYTKISWGFG